MVKMLSNHSLGFYLNQVKLIFAGFGLMKVHMQPTNHPYFTRNNYGPVQTSNFTCAEPNATLG